MDFINFPGFTAVKNFAPFDVEFQCNSFVYSLKAGQCYNMLTDLAFFAIKNTVYKIDPDGHTYSYVLPAHVTPEEEIPVRTGNLSTDYLFQDPTLPELKSLSVPFTDRVKHVQVTKDFSLIGRGEVPQ